MLLMEQKVLIINRSIINSYAEFPGLILNIYRIIIGVTEQEQEIDLPGCVHVCVCVCMCVCMLGVCSSKDYLKKVVRQWNSVSVQLHFPLIL